MTPFSSEPTIIVVEPPDHGTDVEGAIDGVKLVGCTGDASTMWDCGAFDDGTKKFGALFEAESFETTAESVKEDVAGSVELGGC
jgi:hypothetical protein